MTEAGSVKALSKRGEKNARLHGCRSVVSLLPAAPGRFPLQLIQLADKVFSTQVRVALEHLHRLVAADG